MQIIVLATLAVISFKISGIQATKAAPRSLFNVAAPQSQTPKLLVNVIANASDVLKGVKGVHIAVENLSSSAMAQGLNKDAIHNLVEVKIRRNGIHVYSEDELRQVMGQPYVYVNINARDGVANVRVTCRQTVLSTAQPDVQIIAAIVWERSGMCSLKRALDATDLFVDEFCLDFLKANPK